MLFLINILVKYFFVIFPLFKSAAYPTGGILNEQYDEAAVL